MKLRILPPAIEDIGEQANFYKRVASSLLAKRWRIAVRLTVQSLRSLPQRGSHLETTTERWQSIRHLPIQGFPDHFLHYEYDVSLDQILVLRIVHGARDLAPFRLEASDNGEPSE